MSRWDVFLLFLSLWCSLALTALLVGGVVGYILQECGAVASAVIEVYYRKREAFLHRLGSPPASEVPEEISGYKN